MPRSFKFAIIGLATTVFVGLAALIYVHMRLAAPTGKPDFSVSKGFEVPPWEPAPIKFTAPNMSLVERRSFLSADFTLLRRVADLPPGLRKLYEMHGLPHIAIADPGEAWQATDVITDENIPTRRLVFAGTTQDRAFILYEAGGVGRSYVVELYRIERPDIAVGLWRGYCNHAKIPMKPMQLAECCD